MLQPIKDLIQLTYVLAWLVGYYFQIVVLYKTKTGDGMSIDNQLLSFIGVVDLLYFNTYKLIQLPDFFNVLNFAYAMQYLLLIAFTFGLTLYYPRTHNKFRYIILTIFAIFVLMTAVYYWLGVIQMNQPIEDFRLFVGLGLSIICMLRFLYQIALNYDRKSTIGFAIEHIIADITGSVCIIALSLIQYSGEEGTVRNIPLIVTAFVCLVCGAAILYQHFVLYAEQHDMKNALALQQDAEIEL